MPLAAVSFRRTGRGIATVGGGVYCWGHNSDGAVGIGATTNNEPVRTVVPPVP